MFPSVWLSVIFASSLLEGIIPALRDALSLPHTLIPTVIRLYLLFHCLFLSYSASPGCVCQWHSVVLCGGSTSGTAVSHKSASSFNRYRWGLSLCLWICATYCIFTFLFIASPRSAQPHFVNLSVPPLFSLAPPPFPFHPRSSPVLIELSRRVSVSSVSRLHAERSIQSLLCTVYSIPSAILQICHRTATYPAF